MSVFARPPDVVTRDPITVMLATCADELPEIQRLWPWFEELVGLRGRKMYGAALADAHTYLTCTPVRPGDDPDRLGLQVDELPGGTFRRGRLRGEPPGVYASIGPGVQELEAAGLVDRARPVIEFYKRRDEIELWVPIPCGGVREPQRVTASP